MTPPTLHQPSRSTDCETTRLAMIDCDAHWNKEAAIKEHAEFIRESDKRIKSQEEYRNKILKQYGFID